jgi:hypothetical protein
MAASYGGKRFIYVGFVMVDGEGGLLPYQRGMILLGNIR